MADSLDHIDRLKSIKQPFLACLGSSYLGIYSCQLTANYTLTEPSVMKNNIIQRPKPLR